MKADHSCKFNFLILPKFGKYKTTNKTLLNHFLCCLSYGWTIHHPPGMNRKMWGTRLILRPCPEHCDFCVSSRWMLDRKDTASWSYRWVLEFTQSITQHFKVQVAAAYADIKGMCCCWEMLHAQSSCCYSVQLLN